MTSLEYWLASIVEDNPLPYEIKYIVFILHLCNSKFFLEMGGCDLFPNNSMFFPYYPLEAQFFYDKNLVVAGEINGKIKRVKMEIDESFSSLEIQKEFKGRKVYLYNNNKFIYLFKV